MKRGVERAGEILKRVIKKLGIDKKMEEQIVFSVWDETVGKGISMHTRPASFRRGKLLVFVENSAYIQEYSFLKKDMQEKLNDRLRKNLIREIVFRVGNGGEGNAKRKKEKW